MIRMLTACTQEIDEIQVALDEIHAQLAQQEQLLDNSIGILTCYPEFIDSGVVKALCASLPFEVIGSSTFGNSTGDRCDTLQLCLAVITSDALRFSTAIKGPVTVETYDDVVTSAYKEAAEPFDEPASLVIAMLPMVMDLGGELIAQSLYRAVGDIPVFGTLSCDHTEMFEHSYTILNGQAERNAIALLLIEGPLKPRFLITSISEDHIQKHRAVITDSEGYMLRGVNGMTLVEHMEALGMARHGGLNATRSVPLIIDYNDGTDPVARAILQLTPEGHAICCGLVPTDATLALGSIDAQNVLHTTEETLQQVLAEEDIHGALMFSCVARNYVLSADIMVELCKVRDTMSDKLPYLMSYSGGELCPQYTNEGKPINRFHNFTFTACIF